MGDQLDGFRLGKVGAVGSWNLDVLSVSEMS